VYAFEVSTDDPQLSALSNFKADCLHQALSFLPKSSVDVRHIEVARAMRLTSNSIEPVTFRVPRLKVLSLQFFSHISYMLLSYGLEGTSMMKNDKSLTLQCYFCL